MSDTVYKLQKRVETYSTEAEVYQVGDNRISVEIPGVSDANAILEELGTPGTLEFKTTEGETFMTGEMVADAPVSYTHLVFEGLKAYTTVDGKVVIFRPDLNASRMADSARRLEMPVYPEDKFIEAVEKTVKANFAYVPPYGTGATLYIRPYMFGSSPVIGVKPAQEYQLSLIHI